eukprot:8280352-Pyramimonas_sp.AAC.1
MDKRYMARRSNIVSQHLLSVLGPSAGRDCSRATPRVPDSAAGRPARAGGGAREIGGPRRGGPGGTPRLDGVGEVIGRATRSALRGLWRAQPAAPTCAAHRAASCSTAGARSRRASNIGH